MTGLSDVWGPRTVQRQDQYAEYSANGHESCRRAGVGSTTFTLAQMTVAMLLWSSVMTSCCWSTGHGAVICMMISPSRWRSGTVLSYKSTPHVQNVGKGTICSQLLLRPRILSTHCVTVSWLSARVKHQRWKHWRSGLSGAIRRAVHRGAVGQPSRSSMVQAIMSLTPTNLSIFLHLKRVQFKILLWKAADRLGPLYVSTSLRIWLGDQRWNNLS